MTTNSDRWRGPAVHKLTHNQLIAFTGHLLGGLEMAMLDTNPRTIPEVIPGAVEAALAYATEVRP